MPYIRTLPMKTRSLPTPLPLTPAVQVWLRILGYWLSLTRVVVVDMPLLFETGSDRYMHENVLVHCPEVRGGPADCADSWFPWLGTPSHRTGRPRSTFKWRASSHVTVCPRQMPCLASGLRCR